ncbi:MAG: hypothetical protein Q9174_005419, partial [Haloplaca sp. 1 TL-2023]
MYWDSRRRYRVLFSGRFGDTDLWDALGESTYNVALGLASALKDHLSDSGFNVDVWGHHTKIDGSETGTLGVSVRDLANGGFMALRFAIQEWFE